MSSWNLLLRRSHLYLGLVLLPWMVIYAVSTVFFNHGAGHGHGPAAAEWTTLWEKPYHTSLPRGEDSLRATAERVLQDSDLKGPFGVQLQGTRLTINLLNFLRPTRVTYEAKIDRLRAEARPTSSAREVLARLHTRTGYGRGGVLSDVWAVIVDLYCVATFVWIGTGLFLWWKLSFTRTWGFVALAGGLVTIGALLATV